MTFGKTIKIYLKDAIATGIRFGEIVNNTILAISCPRSRLEELALLPETQKPGVYFLIGDDGDKFQMAYIGESENAFSRLQTHIIEKEFWNEVIFIISKDENLTKSHVKYLEGRLIQIAQLSARYKIDNVYQSKPSSLPPSDKDAMEEFLIYIKLLLSTLGHKLLEDPVGEIKKDNTQLLGAMPASESNNQAHIELSLVISGYRANAIQTDEGIVVLKGSEAAKDHTEKLSTGYKDFRGDLIKRGVLVLNGHKYHFTQNTLFTSASSASSVIVGYNTNGLLNWKDKSGKTLKEIELQKLNSAT